MAIKGLIMLKNAYGAKLRTGTPNTADCVAPQVFQGTSTDVTVPESSRVRLSSSGFNPLSLYVLENILPGTTMAIY